MSFVPVADWKYTAATCEPEPTPAVPAATLPGLALQPVDQVAQVLRRHIPVLATMTIGLAGEQRERLEIA